MWCLSCLHVGCRALYCAQIKVLGKQEKIITVSIGPGFTNALLISQLHKLGYSAAGTIVGQCPSVGVSGEALAAVRFLSVVVVFVGPVASHDPRVSPVPGC